MQFAANLDYLWTDAPVSQAIVGAAQAGFDAVELGVLAAQDIDAVIAAQEATGMEILSLSVSRGNIARDDCGLAAVPGREGAASLAIDQAIAQAVTLGVPLVEVTAGRAQGPAAYDTLLGNLDYACSQAALHGLKVAMGPQNSRDVVGGFLSSLGLCRQVMADLNHDALRLVFDCYDVARSDGDLSGHLTDCLDNIGVLRFAGVPDRGAPDRGEVNFAYLFRHIEALGYAAPLSASYRPTGRTERSLSWMRSLRPAVIRPWQLAASAGR